MFVCPKCRQSTAQVCSSIELGGDTESEANRLQVLSCTACDFSGAAASTEPLGGGPERHRACRLERDDYQALICVVDACPAPDDPACTCPAHLVLGLHHDGRWPGLATLGRTTEHELRPRVGPADVLIVDDDDDLRTSLACLLEDCGYAVARARSGREALTYLRRNPPPFALVVDLLMPGMSGLKLRSEVQGTDGLQDVPVLVFTAAGDHHLDSVGLKVTEVLRKPTGLPTLVARLDAILGRRPF